MLRVTQVVDDDDSGRVLHLEGRLIGPWVHELRVDVDRLLEQPVALRLDAAHVTYADEAGLELLRDLLRRGVKIESWSPLLSALLGEESEP